MFCSNKAVKIKGIFLTNINICSLQYWVVFKKNQPSDVSLYCSNPINISFNNTNQTTKRINNLNYF